MFGIPMLQSSIMLYLPFSFCGSNMPGSVGYLPYLEKLFGQGLKCMATAGVCGNYSFNPGKLRIWDFHGFLL